MDIGFDTNALYPRSMMFPLTSGGFEWVDPAEAIQALSTYDLNTSNISSIQCGRFQSNHKTPVNSPTPMTSACSCINLQDSPRLPQTHVGTSTRVHSYVHESHSAFIDLQGNPRTFGPALPSERTAYSGL
jgi:hypothetical protein